MIINGKDLGEYCIVSLASDESPLFGFKTEDGADDYLYNKLPCRISGEVGCQCCIVEHDVCKVEEFFEDFITIVNEKENKM